MSALTPSLFYSSNNQSGGIIHLVYLSAWLLPPSTTSLAALLTKKPFPSQVQLAFTDDNQLAWATNAADAFYNDISDRARAEQLSEGNVSHNWSAVVGEMKFDEGGRKPVWMDAKGMYLISEEDKAIDPKLQREMVEDIISTPGVKGLEVVVLKGAGHCAFLSRPEQVIQLVEGVAEGLEK